MGSFKPEVLKARGVYLLTGACAPANRYQRNEKEVCDGFSAKSLSNSAYSALFPKSFFHLGKTAVIIRVTDFYAFGLFTGTRPSPYYIKSRASSSEV